MRGTRVRTTSAARLAAVVTASVLLTGCSGGEPPSELPVPDVTWPDGAPSGEIEDSRWVQIVREAEVLSSVAWNNLDYSDPALINAWGYETVLEVLHDYAELRFVPAAYDTEDQARSLLDWGPNPLIILDVADEGDSGVVTACAVAGRTITGDIWNVVVREYRVRDLGNGSTEISYEDESSAPSELGLDQCTTDAMPEPVFNPAPELPSGPDVTLRPPADRKVYEELRAGEE